MTAKTATMSLIAAAFAAHHNALVTASRDGEETKYRVARLSDKLGNLSDGKTKGEYVVLTKEGEDSIVVNLHPKQAETLFRTGESDGGYKLDEGPKAFEMPTATEPTTEAPAKKATKAKQGKAPAKKAAKKATTKQGKAPAKKAAKKAKPAADVEDKGPSKKEQAIEIVTAGIKGKVARKDTIEKMKTDLGMSAAGANTYYQNVKAKKEGWTPSRKRA